MSFLNEDQRFHRLLKNKNIHLETNKIEKLKRFVTGEFHTFLIKNETSDLPVLLCPNPCLFCQCNKTYKLKFTKPITL